MNYQKVVIILGAILAGLMAFFNYLQMNLITKAETIQAYYENMQNEI